MCDGVTQGQPGMELSLFSRDVIAHGHRRRAVAQHVRRRAVLGVCDKIVPGLLIGALHFGHLPASSCPAGPMPSGLSNNEKAQGAPAATRKGKVGRDALLEAEGAAYHGPGTCTFYGTANSNQMLMEVMGLHLPGAAFVNPNTPLREALTAAAATRAVRDHRARRRRTRRSAASSTSARSSTPSSACWPPAARPTTPSTWWRWRARPAS